MTIEIVQGTLEHLEGFHATLDAVARERRYLAQTKAKPIEELRKFISERNAKGDPVFFALADGVVVGWCDITRGDGPMRDHAGNLGMGVRSGYRGQGIGGRLISAALESGKSSGMKRIELTVYSNNAVAHALYLKMGFVEEGRMRSYAKIEGAFTDAIKMAWVDPSILNSTARSSS
jgi:RimJ/RimL family protein N-acetyltransferase